jgi:hypothetical protein
LAADHEFAACVGVKKTDKVDFCCNFLGKMNFHPKTGFLEVQEVGFAFVLQKREVIERMVEGYPELYYKTDGGGEREYALFLDMLENEVRFSEDFSFCRRWRAIGGQIWVDPYAALLHSGMKHYTGKISDLFVEVPEGEVVAA